jgi:YVTN family beta-propeller protein
MTRGFLSLSSLILVICSTLQHVACAPSNDKQYGNSKTGSFYAFSSTGIYVIDPDDGVINTIPVTSTSSWGDPVFIRDQAQLRHYVFANDRTNNDVWVIDTSTQDVLKQVDVGKSPVHIYAVPWRDEVWTHLDAEGTFDVFRMSEPRYRCAAGVRALTTAVSNTYASFLSSFSNSRLKRLIRPYFRQNTASWLRIQTWEMLLFPQTQERGKYFKSTFRTKSSQITCRCKIQAMAARFLVLAPMGSTTTRQPAPSLLNAQILANASLHTLVPRTALDLYGL